MTMTHLPGPAPTDGSPGARNPQGSGHGKGGGISHGRRDLTTARAAWRVAAAGPAASLMAAGISTGAALGLSALGAGLLPVTVFAALAWINSFLVIFNLLPGAGLDGGRIVRAVAWARSGDPTRATQLGALHLGQSAR